MEREKKYNIILVDDNIDFLVSINIFLEREEHLSIIGHYSTPEMLIESEKLDNTDLILLDIEMPKITGFQAAKMILQEYPEIKMMALTNYKEKVFINEFISAGFKGCVYKDEVYFNLKPAIKTLLNGNLYF